MITIAWVSILCLTFLVAQHRSQDHERTIKAGQNLLFLVEKRVCALERKKPEHFDPVAFEELKSKVDALRLAQGLKGSR